MGIVFECYAQTIAIATEDPEILATLPAYLPPERRPSVHPNIDREYRVERIDSGYRVSCGDEVLGEAADATGACEGLEGELNLFLAEFCPDRIFVHAGVVAHRGAAIVIPGRSFSGKSSLVDALVRAGARYASDEFAPLDAEGFVHPYPRSLKLRRRGESGRADRIPVHRLGGSVEGPLPVAIVLSTRYAPGARWEPRDMSWGEAMLAMLSNTVPAQSRPQMVLPFLRAGLSRARYIGGVRGEADEMAGALLDLIP